MESEKKTIAILIVLYGKKVIESETITSLLKTSINNIHICIHNNGPGKISIENEIYEGFKSKNINIDLVNCIDNKPLGILYNDFIKDNVTASKIVILDDDSTVTDSFVSEMMESKHDLSLPKIFSKTDRKQYYPIKENKLLSDSGVVSDIKDFFSIGSGLIISRELVNLFKDNNIELFDENYALYGVDFSFFRRLTYLKHRGCDIKISLNCNIVHSLSRTESRQSIFRRKERLMDLAITTKRYTSLELIKSFIKQMVKSFFVNGPYVTYIVFISFLKGQHPKVISWKKSKLK